MTIKTTFQTILLAVLLCGVSASAKIAQPNEFYFTSEVYYVEINATNAVIEVGFVAGNPGRSGTVDYKASNSHTVEGQTTSVTSTLSFSGLSSAKTFTVSIPLDSLRQGTDTIVLSLSNPDATISRGTAIVKFKPLVALR